MTRENKTILVAVWPDGHRHEVRKVHGFWEYGTNRAGYPLTAAKRDAENYDGVKFHREPNPRYREPDVLDRFAGELHKLLTYNVRNPK